MFYGKQTSFSGVVLILVQRKGSPMPLISLVVILVVVGVLLWLINNYVPMDGKIKNILNIVVVIGVLIWLLQALGMMGSISAIHVGR